MTIKDLSNLLFRLPEDTEVKILFHDYDEGGIITSEIKALTHSIKENIVFLADEVD